MKGLPRRRASRATLERVGSAIGTALRGGLHATSLLLGAYGIASASCTGCTPPFRQCADIDPSLLDALPTRLSDSGLFRNMATEELETSVYPFRPRFELWSDGATKRRWIRLPPGTQIDTSDPDEWRFPVGTKLWKEFTRHGVRVETRLLFKHGPGIGDWTPVAYVWSEGDAWATPAGMKNALGTPHDVPSAAQCVGCHGGTKSGVLGFSAIQLPASGEGDHLGLASLERAGLLTHPLPRGNDLPGDPNTRAALGYLHANCGHCHNDRRPKRDGPRCFDPENSLDFQLRLRDLERPEHTAAYRTGIGEAIRPGNPAESNLLIRVRSRDPWWGMPALGSEEIDRRGNEILARWIEAL